MDAVQSFAVVLFVQAMFSCVVGVWFVSRL